MTPDGGRTWGYWTQLKLAMLRDYLSRFSLASKALPERIYLDAFAGEGDGRDRLTGEEFHGSARIALDIAMVPASHDSATSSLGTDLRIRRP